MKRILFLLVIPLLTVAYASKAPDLVWNKSYDPGPRADEGRGIAIGGDGYIYITGYHDNGKDYDWCTVKYSPNGTREWAKLYDSHKGDDFADGIAIGPDGYVYVCGGDSARYLIIRYAPSGEVRGKWEIPNSPGRDYARDIVLDAQGNVYVTGADYNGVANQYLTAKLNPKSGDILWRKTYNTSKNENGWGIAMDKSGYLYVTGSSGERCYTIKYDPEGREQWSKPYSKHDEDYAYDVATDDAGNMYVAGVAYTDKTKDYDFLILKYTSNGELLWDETYNFSQEDKALGITVNKAGYLYVAGCSKDRGRYNFRIVKYNSDGELLWTKTYNSGDDDIARDIAIDPEGGYIYVTGLTKLWPNSEFRTLKYRQYLSISGYIRDEGGTGVEGVKVELKGPISDLYTTASDGYYEFNNLPCDENYTITPSKVETGAIWSFSPEKLFYTPLGSDEANQDFTAKRTGIEEKELTDYKFLIRRIIPNPSNLRTVIEYEVPEKLPVQLTVYNPIGTPVKILDRGERKAGRYRIVWDGREVSSGVYFLRLRAGEKAITEKLIIMR